MISATAAVLRRGNCLSHEGFLDTERSQVLEPLALEHRARGVMKKSRGDLGARREVVGVAVDDTATGCCDQVKNTPQCLPRDGAPTVVTTKEQVIR